MSITPCKDPTSNDENFKSNTYYPPGIISKHKELEYYYFIHFKLKIGSVCGTEQKQQFCPTSGDSGSVLMVKNEDMEFEAEGLLSFIKSCDTLNFGPIGPDCSNYRLIQSASNPIVYTKLYCFLPWIAHQYGHEYKDSETDQVQIHKQPTVTPWAYKDKKLVSLKI